MAAPTSAPPKKRRTLARREARLAWIFVLPAAIIVLGLVLFPVIWNISLSLQRLRLIDLQHINFFRFEGTLRNFRAVVGVRDFWQTIWTTLEYTVFGTILSMVMGLWAALVVRRTFRGRSLVRGLMLFPYVTPVIAAAFVWQLMLNQTFGIANEWIAAAGGQRIDFLGTRFYELSLFGAHLKVPLALTMVILFEGWRYFPFAFLFILARLQAIPAELDEAAMVDGATLSQRFWYVTLPQLRGVFSVLFLLRFIWTFNKFDDIFLLTGGAAGTQVITVKIIEWLRGRGDIGAAAALGLVLAAILMVLLFVYFKWFYEEDEA
ncbi:inner membrane ABC transporter permease protein YcjO [bacterium BMS3Abin02]|nr:inner membrane ABC transporter permease protein YcjO [bacterium BMS3Abin02]HDK45607.1 sugar ABC transporter permease [Actinomycetota bacterium]HDL49452.1 sugar ABC transporter permease [Actinomycetota bacterium]